MMEKKSQIQAEFVIFKKAILIVMQIYFTLPILSCRGRSAPKMENSIV